MNRAHDTDEGLSAGLSVTGALRECACGCGLRFKPFRPFHRYAVNPETGISHRFKAHGRLVRLTEQEARMLAGLLRRSFPELVNGG